MAKPSRPAASYRAARKAAARALAKINRVQGAPSRQVARDVERFEAMRRVSAYADAPGLAEMLKRDEPPLAAAA